MITHTVKRLLIAANWKMNLDHYAAITLVQKLSFSIPKYVLEKIEVALFPPYTDIRSVQTLVAGEKILFQYGAQDISPHDAGAYTGDISGAFLKRLGCSYVIIGHSERRNYHNETNELVARKIAAAIKFSLIPILCVGEGEEIRNSGKHVEYNQNQLLESIAGLDYVAAEKLVLAYEPIWAIGTGKVADAADAQLMGLALRQVLEKQYDKQLAKKVRILYGGSVTAHNISDLVVQKDIDGALVGGASLKADEFANLINKAICK